jgi:hypothetical protein
MNKKLLIPIIAAAAFYYFFLRGNVTPTPPQKNSDTGNPVLDTFGDLGFID